MLPRVRDSMSATTGREAGRTSACSAIRFMGSCFGGGVGPGDDPSDVPVNDRWLLSMSQRRKDR